MGGSAYTSNRRSLVRTSSGETSGFSRLSGEACQALSCKDQERRGATQCRSKEATETRQGRQRKRERCQVHGADGGATGSVDLKHRAMKVQDEGCGQQAFPELDRATLKVPGSGAPTLCVLKIWNSLHRWILEAKTPFAEFLHSFRRNAPAAEAGSTRPLWPISAPYPRWLAASGNEKVKYSVMARQKAVNLTVLLLSWLHMQRPAVAPSSMYLGAPLFALQWKMVKQLERQFYALEQEGLVGPKEMGRTAAKVESLGSLLDTLHDEFSTVAPKGYTGFCTAASPQSRSRLQAGSSSTAAGVVVGRISTGVPSLAKDIEPSRLSFPKDAAEFNPTDLLDEPHKTVYTNPTSLAREPDLELDRPPRVQVRASEKRTWELIRFLDDHRRLGLAAPHQVRETHLCGAFSLVKDVSKDRLIVDARPPNELEETLREWCSTLGSIGALAQIELQHNHHMFFSGTDLRDTIVFALQGREISGMH